MKNIPRLFEDTYHRGGHGTCKDLLEFGDNRTIGCYRLGDISNLSNGRSNTDSLHGRSYDIDPPSYKKYKCGYQNHRYNNPLNKEVSSVDGIYGLIHCRFFLVRFIRGLAVGAMNVSAILSGETGLSRKVLYQAWLKLDKVWDREKEANRSLERR